MRLILLILFALTAILGCSTEVAIKNEVSNDGVKIDNKNQIGQNFKIYNNSRY